jgi:YndJ-like protein
VTAIAASAPFPVVFGSLTIVDLLLLLAPVIVVPLGLRLAPLSGPYAKRLLVIARYAQPLGALSLVAAFLAPVGPGGLLAAPWLAVSGIAGLSGLAELIESRSLRPAHLIPAASLGFLTVGAAWVVALRAGIGLGYGPTVVELTAVHFHYAGFGATMLSALAMARLGSGSARPAWLASFAGLLVMLGTLITAAGFATGLLVLTLIGPVPLATGVLTTAGLMAFVIAPRLAPAPRWLLTLSAAGVVIPMLLGVDYAASRLLPIPALDLRAMALVHGDLNAIVFVLIGFIGWTLA